jgi:ribosomal protein L7/L12
MATEPTQEQIDQIVNALASGRQIEAIKILRESTGRDLREAKEFIDALVEKMKK